MRLGKTSKLDWSLSSEGFALGAAEIKEIKEETKGRKIWIYLKEIMVSLNKNLTQENIN